MNELIAHLPSDGSAIPYEDWREAIMRDNVSRQYLSRIHETRRRGLVIWNLSVDENGNLTLTTQRADTLPEAVSDAD